MRHDWKGPYLHIVWATAAAPPTRRGHDGVATDGCGVADGHHTISVGLGNKEALRVTTSLVASVTLAEISIT